MRRDFPNLVGLVEAGRLDLASLISRRFRLDEINDAIAALSAGEVIRAVLT